MHETVWQQVEITLPPFKRGFHLISQVIEERIQTLNSIECGLLHLFIRHTSASLSINENACPLVAQDLEDHMNRLCPEDAGYLHTEEGVDDMPAHVKTTLIGSSITVPIKDSKLLLGKWQGIFLCEHRNHARPRSLILTMQGSAVVSSLKNPALATAHAG